MTEGFRKEYSQEHPEKSPQEVAQSLYNTWTNSANKDKDERCDEIKEMVDTFVKGKAGQKEFVKEVLDTLENKVEQDLISGVDVIGSGSKKMLQNDEDEAMLESKVRQAEEEFLRIIDAKHSIYSGRSQVTDMQDSGVARSRHDLGEQLEEKVKHLRGQFSKIITRVLKSTSPEEKGIYVTNLEASINNLLNSSHDQESKQVLERALMAEENRINALEGEVGINKHAVEQVRKFLRQALDFLVKSK